jgi:hypothetical protein
LKGHLKTHSNCKDAKFYSLDILGGKRVKCHYGSQLIALNVHVQQIQNVCRKNDAIWSFYRLCAKLQSERELREASSSDDDGDESDVKGITKDAIIELEQFL